MVPPDVAATIAAQKAQKESAAVAAGLAMLRVLQTAFTVAFKDRFTLGALVTFLVTVADVAILNIGAPFWGNDFGGAVSAAPGFALLAWLLFGRPLRWRTVGGLALILVAATGFAFKAILIKILYGEFAIEAETLLALRLLRRAAHGHA